MPARNKKLKEKANMGTRKKELAVKAPSLSLALSFLTSPSFLERPGKGKGKKRPRESAERKEEIGEKAAALTIFLPSLVFFSGLATRVSWPFFLLVHGRSECERDACLDRGGPGNGKGESLFFRCLLVQTRRVNSRRNGKRACEGKTSGLLP